MRYKINGKEVSREEFTAGGERRLEEMLEARTPPGGMTDAVFLEGRGGCYDQFEGNPFLGDYYKRVAESHGQDVTGKVYLSGLARFPGDPQAWVSGRGDVQRVCRERGWGAEGAVSEPVRLKCEVTGGGLASSLVDEKVQEALEEDPSAREEDVREAVIERHAPHWAKREV